MRKHYPFIFSLNAVPALLRYPKLFARYSLRTILTATPTHTPCFRHRRRSCSLPSSKRGTPPFKICSISKLFTSCEALQLPTQFRNLPLAISNLPFCSSLASGNWHLATSFRTSHSAFRTQIDICHFIKPHRKYYLRLYRDLR